VKKQTTIIVLSVLSFITIVVTVSILLANKNNKEGENATSQEHHMGQQKESEDKLNLLMGKEAPDFTLYNFDNKKVSLSDYKGKKVVLFFTEGVMCYPACWNQIAAFGKDDVFKKDDTAVLTVVVDTKGEWDRAVKKMPELLSSQVLFDASKSVSEEYGVLSLASSMHKGQFPGHTYLVLDKDGIVKFIMDDPKMAVRNDELKAALEKLN
jgi:peroxiredoxin Q/BCP